jgi:hypothetical protein
MEIGSLVWSEEEIKGYARAIYALHWTDTCLDRGIFFIMPWARKKYWPEFEGSCNEATRHLAREFVPMRSRSVADVETFADLFYRCVLRCDVPPGAHVAHRANGTNVPIPRSAMAIYASIMPHDEVQGMYKASQDFMHFLYDHAPHERFRTHARITSAIHKSPCVGRTKLMDLDVDTKDPLLLAQLVACFGDLGVWDAVRLVIETRGGFHVLLASKEVGKAYPAIAAFCKAADKDARGDPWCSMSSKDNVVPLPGTVQGGFRVRLVTVDEFKTY